MEVQGRAEVGKGDILPKPGGEVLLQNSFGFSGVERLGWPGMGLRRTREGERRVGEGDQ